MGRVGAPTHDFYGSLRQLNALFSSRDRMHVAVLVLLMLVAAGLEVFGVGAIPAFVAILVAPDALARYPRVDAFVASLGVTSPNALVVWGMVALIGVFVVKNGFLILNDHFQKRFISHRRIHIARWLVDAYMHAPYPFYLRRNTSELIRNVERETSLIANQVLSPLLAISTRLIIMLAVLAFLLVAEPWITLIWVLLFGLIGGLGVRKLSRRLERLGLEEQRHRQRVVQRLTEGFGSIKESRVLGRERFFAEQIDDSIEAMSEANRFKQFTASAVPPITELFAVVGLAGIAATLMLLGRAPDTILVTLALFGVGIVRLRETISAAMSHLTNLRYNVMAVDPVHRDLEALAPGKAVARVEAVRPVPLEEDIELEGVWFRYEPASAFVLEDVSLHIPRGAAAGFVGGTGAGKSTLVDLILGLLVPERGHVRVDGDDIHSSDRLRSWQRSVGYVPQTIFLLDDTIRRNIALGLEDDAIDEARVAAAVHQAQLEPLLARLPEGLDTVIGERGVRLSGGERQRIGIARALYDQPEVLILDEATSALDNVTERAIIDAVEALKGRRTVVMIAHRLSTVKSCDTLFFLNEGRVEASGRFDELQEQNARFRRMAQVQ